MPIDIAIAVVGGGASGCLAALHSARAAVQTRRRVRIVVIEPSRLGRGLAYSTTDLGHRLNVPASNMSAYPDRPDHFLRWLRARVDDAFPADGFASRMHYGRYLEHCLNAETAGSDWARVEHRRVRALDLQWTGERVEVLLSNAEVLHLEAAVIATGYGPPTSGWAPPSLRSSAHFVSDPWAAELPSLATGSDIVLIGAGPTAVDMITLLPRDHATVHVVSRHGMLPLAHASEPTRPRRLDNVPRGAMTARDLRRLVFAHIRSSDGDWRAAVDGLRPITSQLWALLDDDEGRRVVNVAARRWDRVRHRLAPDVWADLNERVSEGTVVIHSGEVQAHRDTASGAEVTLSDGAVIDAAAVVNCTGASVKLEHSPLLTNLLDAGLIRPGRLGIGVAASSTGQTKHGVPLWVLGPLRRGDLWESVAIPEIRCQAVDLATAVVDHTVRSACHY